MLRMLWLVVIAVAQTLQSRMARGPARPTWPLSFEAMIRFLRLDWEQTSAWDVVRLRALHPGGTEIGLRWEVLTPPFVRRRSPSAVFLQHRGSS